MDLERAVGLRPDGAVWLPERRAAISSILLKLAAMGVRIPAGRRRPGRAPPGRRSLRALSRADPAPLRAPVPRRPADPALHRRPARLGRGFPGPVRLPGETLILDRYGLARELSLPIDAEAWHNELVSSYRLDNGVLHNPVNDRRTTQGVFHVAEGGLPIPADKLRVPLRGLPAAARRRRCARRPSSCACRSPPTGRSRWRPWSRCCCGHWCAPRSRRSRRRSAWKCGSSCPAAWSRTWTSWRASSATRATPTCPGNDAALDVDGWTGHSGCVILAPHLTRLRKKDLGLPHVSRATDAERAAGMCWAEESELYNDGRPFKITSRGMDGVMVTILADNYFGYCKKEVKTQIGYSANLFGLAEEEHAGGALAFATFNLGDRFVPDQVRIVSANHRFAEVRALLGDARQFHDSGYATDAIYPEIHYMPEDMEIDVHRQDIKWVKQGPGAAPQAPARPDLHPPERLQGPHGQAPSGAELAADRDGAGGRLLPQAVHRLGRRQVGDQQEPGRRRAARVVLRAELRGRHGPGPGDLRPGLRRRALPDLRAATRADLAADPVSRSLARLGDQAAHAQPRRVHAGVQRLAREHPELCARAGLRDQALLPAGVGRRLASATSASTSSTARPDTSSSTRAGGSSPAISGSAARRTAPGGRTSCGRTSSRPTRCRWRTTSPPRWWSRRAGWSGSPASTTGTRA